MVCGALLGGLPCRAPADLPAVSRQLQTENDTIAPESLASRRSLTAGIATGWLTATLDRRVEPGSERHFLVGGGSLSREWGRWSLGAEAFWDGGSKLEADELSASGGLAVYAPEVRTDLRAEFGAGPAGHIAGQVESETRLLRVKLLHKRAEFWPNLYSWNRLRWADEEYGMRWTPAIGLVSSTFQSSRAPWIWGSRLGASLARASCRGASCSFNSDSRESSMCSAAARASTCSPAAATAIGTSIGAPPGEVSSAGAFRSTAGRPGA